ncbi:MAG: ribonuclease HII [Pseudolabrys sp.]
MRPTFRRERRWLTRAASPSPVATRRAEDLLAGPVVAAAVILDPARIPRGLNDSKSSMPGNARRFTKRFCANAEVAVAFGSIERIDRGQYSCVPRSGRWPARSRRCRCGRSWCSSDGNMKIDCGCDCEAVVSGDALVASIAAASIVAKVTRDRLMKRLGLAHPGYGFERHMGYSVPEHFRALAALGPTIHHRRSFAPVAAKLAALGTVSDEVIAELLPL